MRGAGSTMMTLRSKTENRNKSTNHELNRDEDRNKDPRALRDTDAGVTTSACQLFHALM